MIKVVATRTSDTGAEICLIDNRDGSFEAETVYHKDGTVTENAVPKDIRWATVCDEHGSYLSHATRALATSAMAEPEEWCNGCDNDLTIAGEQWDEMRLEA